MILMRPDIGGVKIMFHKYLRNNAISRAVWIISFWRWFMGKFFNGKNKWDNFIWLTRYFVRRPACALMMIDHWLINHKNHVRTDGLDGSPSPGLLLWYTYPALLAPLPSLSLNVLLNTICLWNISKLLQVKFRKGVGSSSKCRSVILQSTWLSLLC